MSEQDRKPQTGDRVRVSFETTVASGAPSPYLVWVDVDDGPNDPVSRIVCVPTYAVEVLEPVDDPGKDPKGTVRLFEPGVPAICYGKDFWVYFVEGTGYGVAKGTRLVGKPVIGVVPGTPADEAQRTVPAESLFPPPAGTAPRVFPCPGQIPPPGLPVRHEDFLEAWVAHGGYMHQLDSDEVPSASGLSWGAMRPGNYIEVTD